MTDAQMVLSTIGGNLAVTAAFALLINNRISDMKESLNKRIEDLRLYLDTRFTDVERRLEALETRRSA
jgi:hypothetical protein